MHWAYTRKLVIFAVVTAALAAALPALGQTGGLTGEARDESGKPMVGYTIQIERQEIRGNYKAKTDKKGHYVYIGLPLGNYKVTLADPNGHEVYHFGGVHVGIGDPTVQDFDMAKEKAAQAEQAKTNPEMQKALAQQKAAEEENKQFTGLKQVFDQGVALQNSKQFAEAAAMFEKAIPLAKEKNLVAVEEHLADSYAGAKQYDKAVETYNKAIELDPNDSALHNSLGSTYAQMNKIPEAQAEFKKAADLDPTHAAQAYYNMGAIFYNTGKMDEAADAFKKASELDPNNAAAYALLGRALMGKLTMGADGKVVAPPGTVEALEKYLKLDPNGPYAQEVTADLQVIQGQVQTEYKVDKKKKK